MSLLQKIRGFFTSPNKFKEVEWVEPSRERELSFIKYWMTACKDLKKEDITLGEMLQLFMKDFSFVLDQVKEENNE